MYHDYAKQHPPTPIFSFSAQFKHHPPDVINHRRPVCPQPKIQTASKFERTIDRRTYVDKKDLFAGVSGACPAVSRAALVPAEKATREREGPPYDLQPVLAAMAPIFGAGYRGIMLVFVCDLSRLIFMAAARSE